MSGSMVNVGMQVWVRLMRGELTVRSVISGLEGLTSLWVTRTKPDQVKPELVAARATRPPSCINRRPWATPASHITWLLLDGTPLASDLGTGTLGWVSAGLSRLTGFPAPTISRRRRENNELASH